MYDEQVKRLRDIASWDWNGMDGEYVERAVKEAADAIEELISKLNHADDQVERLVEAAEERRWIPVTEEPPLKVGDDAYNGYLVYANGYYEVADYTTDKFDNVPYFHVNGEHEPDVTHWMPLPEPPKEE